MKQHRLKVLADAFGFSVSQFEREVGVGVSTFSKAIQRNSAINKGIVLMIKDRYPEVNGDWLLTGEGSMFLTTSDKIKAIAQEAGKPHEEKGIFQKVAGLFKKIPEPQKEDLMTFNEIIEWEEDLLRRYEELKKKNQDKNKNG